MIATPPAGGGLLVTPSSGHQSTPGTSLKCYEGQLNKFTNVVKGWQYRWFVLNLETGNLDYFLMDDGVIGKRRGRQYVAGCVVVPSDEDSQTFHVNFASGESYKLRAANPTDRLNWVDRIRTVAHRHESAMARDNAPPIIHKEYLGPPPGSRSLLSSNGEPSAQLQHLSLSVLDAFGSVHDILQQTDLKHASLTKTVETLPLASSANFPRCHEEELLVLKATSQAALHSMEAALNILQDIRDVQIGNQTVTRHHKSVSPMALSPKKSKNFFHNSFHDLKNEHDSHHSPNISACGSPTRMELHQPSGDALSIKSAAVLETSGRGASGGKTGLSASTSNIDQAGGGHKGS